MPLVCVCERIFSSTRCPMSTSWWFHPKRNLLSYLTERSCNFQSLPMPQALFPHIWRFISKGWVATSLYVPDLRGLPCFWGHFEASWSIASDKRSRPPNTDARIHHLDHCKWPLAYIVYDVLYIRTNNTKQQQNNSFNSDILITQMIVSIWTNRLIVLEHSGALDAIQFLLKLFRKVLDPTSKNGIEYFHGVLMNKNNIIYVI